MRLITTLLLAAFSVSAHAGTYVSASAITNNSVSVAPDNQFFEQSNFTAPTAVSASNSAWSNTSGYAYLDTQNSAFYTNTSAGLNSTTLGTEGRANVNMSDRVMLTSASGAQYVTVAMSLDYSFVSTLAFSTDFSSQSSYGWSSFAYNRLDAQVRLNGMDPNIEYGGEDGPTQYVYSNYEFRQNGSVDSGITVDEWKTYNTSDTTYTAATSGIYLGNYNFAQLVTLPTNTWLTISFAADQASACAALLSCSANVDGTHSFHLGLSTDASTTLSSESGLGYAVATMPVPEPSTYAMLLAGLSMLGFMVRRRTKQN